MVGPGAFIIFFVGTVSMIMAFRSVASRFSRGWGKGILNGTVIDLVIVSSSAIMQGRACGLLCGHYSGKGRERIGGDVFPPEAKAIWLPRSQAH